MQCLSGGPPAGAARKHANGVIDAPSHNLSIWHIVLAGPTDRWILICETIELDREKASRGLYKSITPETGSLTTTWQFLWRGEREHELVSELAPGKHPSRSAGVSRFGIPLNMPPGSKNSSPASAKRVSVVFWRDCSLEPALRSLMESKKIYKKNRTSRQTQAGIGHNAPVRRGGHFF